MGLERCEDCGAPAGELCLSECDCLACLEYIHAMSEPDDG